MSNRRKIKGHPDYPTVQSQSAEELWDRLVSDGVARIPTPISWLLPAVHKIARDKRTTGERVFIDLDDRVRELCGMPLSREPGRL